MFPFQVTPQPAPRIDTGAAERDVRARLDPMRCTWADIKQAVADAEQELRAAYTRRDEARAAAAVAERDSKRARVAYAMNAATVSAADAKAVLAAEQNANLALLRAEGSESAIQLAQAKQRAAARVQADCSGAWCPVARAHKSTFSPHDFATFLSAEPAPAAGFASPCWALSDGRYGRAVAFDLGDAGQEDRERWIPWAEALNVARSLGCLTVAYALGGAFGAKATPSYAAIRVVVPLNRGATFYELERVQSALLAQIPGSRPVSLAAQHDPPFGLVSYGRGGHVRLVGRAERILGPVANPDNLMAPAIVNEK